MAPTPTPPMTTAEWMSFSPDKQFELRAKEMDVAKVDVQRRLAWARGISLAIDATVIVAGIALLGTFFTASYGVDAEKERSRSALTLKRLDARNAFILQGLNADSLDRSGRYVAFLIAKGIIKDVDTAPPVAAATP